MQEKKYNISESTYQIADHSPGKKKKKRPRTININSQLCKAVKIQKQRRNVLGIPGWEREIKAFTREKENRF